MYTITLSNELVNHDLREVIFSSKKLVARDVITLPTVIPLYFWELKTAKIVRIILSRKKSHVYLFFGANSISWGVSRGR